MPKDRKGSRVSISSHHDLHSEVKCCLEPQNNEEDNLGGEGKAPPEFKEGWHGTLEELQASNLGSDEETCLIFISGNMSPQEKEI